MNKHEMCGDQCNDETRRGNVHELHPLMINSEVAEMSNVLFGH